MLQVLANVLLLTTGFTVSCRVAIESQPFDPVSVAVKVPVVLSDCPFQTYGNWLLQVETVVSDVLTGTTVKDNLGIESQPFDPTRVTE